MLAIRKVPGRYLWQISRGLALVLSIVLCALLYDSRQSVEADERPAALIQYPDATAVQYDDREAIDRLSYHVSSKFPAKPVIDLISNKLQKEGWQPLKYYFLRPDTLSSQEQGWQQFLDVNQAPALCVRQWLGDWQDSSGNIVTYGFRYAEVKCTSDPSDLEVTGWYTPAYVARRTLEESERHKKDNNLQ
ncbi:hypothetical protein [Candidatus Binatus sp.]|uniref:hypothetical protein n=1 Tax=Candidatus Binatus sp. TaxID=2811406 RepID=UPI003CB94F8A